MSDAPPIPTDLAEKYVTPVSPPHTETSNMSDFSDKMSPMLVKELRQGMRTNLFAISFVLLQGFMVICVLMGASDPQGSTAAVTGFFWFFLSVTLFLIMPIRGFSALSSEIKLDTLDLLQLTRLGAFRIVFGKWAALVAQTSLFVASVLPYVVMRYFFGGVDIFIEIGLIFGSYLLSCVLTALMVGLSAYNSVLLRLITIAGVVIFGFTMISLSIQSVVMGSVLFVPDMWWSIAVVVLSALYAIYFFLDLGASRIAPDSANHSTRKRGLAVLFVLILMGFNFLGAREELCLAIACAAALLVVIDAITEPPSMVPSIYQSFATNPLKQLAAYFLAPGWHTAINFLLLMFGAFVGFLFLSEASGRIDLDTVLALISVLGCVVAPVLVIQLFFNPVSYSKQYFGMYLLIQLCFSALAIFVVAVADNSSGIGSVLLMCVPIPHVGLYIAENGNDDEVMYFLVAVSLFVAITMVLWLVRAAPLFRRSRETLKLIKSGASMDEIPTERLIDSQ